MRTALDATAIAQLGGSSRAARSVAARFWTSTDEHVGGAANALEAAFPGRVVGVNQNLTMTTRRGYREVDIVLDDVLVQVKRGNAGRLANQIANTTETLGRPTIGFAPNMPNAAWEAAAREGIPIARTHDELIAMVREIGAG